MPAKACKNCKFVIESGDSCPICKGTDLTTNWKGFVIVLDPEKSEIAGKMGITIPGKYALRLGK